MNNEEQLVKHYKSLGYKDLGWVNINKIAIEETQKSKDKQWHKVGRCLHLIACHDIKAFAMCDSSD